MDCQSILPKNSFNVLMWPQFITVGRTVGRIYNLCASHTSNPGFDRTFMPCSGYFYAPPNNERSTKYRGLTYSAKQNCPWIYRATYSAKQTRLRIWFSLKETRSVTMNIYRFFKSFVKVELSCVFTINMFSTAENCMWKWIILLK